MYTKNAQYCMSKYEYNRMIKQAFKSDKIIQTQTQVILETH